jgi:hypothetical protein
VFKLARADDPDFPADFDERLDCMSMQRGINQFQKLIAKFTARANLSVQHGGGEVLDEFVHDIASITIRLICSSPHFRAESIPHISPTTLTRRLQEMSQEAFDRMVGGLYVRIHCMNLLTDSGTVLGFTALLATLLNPNYPGTILPLDTFENRNYDGGHYEVFFRSLISEIIRYEIELVTIVCDNCLAQVNGVAQALAFLPNPAILHIPCLSHIANLVFTQAVLDALVPARIALLNEFIDDLQSPEGLAIVGRKCPTLVKTRWIYAVDVRNFIFCYRDDVNSVQSTLFHNPVPTTFKRLYCILLPLKLFSRLVEARDRKLHEIILLSREVNKDFQAVCALLRATMMCTSWPSHCAFHCTAQNQRV